MKARTGAEALERLDEILAWARSRLEWIENDERFHYKPARVDVNAPLALEQVAMSVEHRCLKAVMGLVCGQVAAVKPAKARP